MQLEIEYFGGAAELTGRRNEIVSLDDGAHGQQLVTLLAERHPRLAPLLKRMRLAVNDEFASLDAQLHDGDRVAVLPPVAGGASTLCELRETPLSVDQAMDAVQHAGAGAIAVFVGVVRDHADGKPVQRLDYEAHGKLALSEMRRVLDAIVQEMPDVRLAALHRTGQLSVGQRAVVIAASAPHRADAFAACRAAIDRIKQSVPIWKHEWAPDGSANWVGLDGDGER